jgi:DNA-binding HxlR family transcriptional regulator
MNKYGQFCPVAKAMELLDERWTLLVIRELLQGSRHWSDLRQGVPRMSPTLLAKRLRTLERYGVIERHRDGNRVAYVPTQACEELRPAVEAIGSWGVRWMGQLGDEDLDPQLLLWDMHRKIAFDLVPRGRTVVQFTFRDIEPRHRDWWLVIHPGEVDVCDEDPGFDVDVAIEGDLRALTQIWRGDRSWSDALRTGRVEIDGAPKLCREFPRWLQLSHFAAVPRPVPA